MLRAKSCYLHYAMGSEFPPDSGLKLVYVLTWQSKVDDGVCVPPCLATMKIHTDEAKLLSEYAEDDKNTTRVEHHHDQTALA